MVPLKKKEGWSSVNLLVVLDRSMWGSFLLQDEPAAIYLYLFVLLIGAGVVFSPFW